MSDETPTSKSPQEKKALSYAKDRRHSFRENDWASRRFIPQRKALESRSGRRQVTQSLCGIERLDDEASDLVESSARHDIKRVGGWRKKPDETLREHIEKRRAGRSSSGEPDHDARKT